MKLNLPDVPKMGGFSPCCCISLKTGSTLIAIVEITLSAIFAGFNLYVIGKLASVHSKDDASAMQAVKDKIQKIHPEMADQEPEAIFTTLYFFLGLMVAMLLLQVGFGCVLLLGIKQERLRLVKLWMIVKASGIVFSVIFTIAIAITQHKQKTYGEVTMDVISILLGLYFLYVVYRLYQEMWTNAQNQQRPKPINTRPAYSFYK